MRNVSNYILEDYLFSFRSGEEKGFNFFFRLHYKALYLYSFRIIRNQEAAEEIVQDAFIRLWERHGNFDHAAAIKSFIFTVGRNAALNWLRSQKREALGKQQLGYISEGSETNVLQERIAAEVYADIYEAINMLPPQCRKIFRMLFFEGKDYRQVAEELNLSISTIRNQKARAIMLLRQRVALTATVIFLVLY